MPDYANRSSAEQALARQLARLGREVQALILERLGDPPNYDNLDAAFWADIQQRYEAILIPSLEGIFISSAEAMAGLDGIPPADIAVVNENAAAWARQYTFDLVGGINDTSRRYLQRTINDFYQTGMDMATLEARIARQFGTRRAANIAITEVTRASVQGELAVVRGLREAGIQMVAVWQTSNDDIVCRICSPLNQTKQGEAWYQFPPAHVGCRCWVNHVFATGATI